MSTAQPITLGGLIDALEKLMPECHDETVYYDFVYFRPHGIASYRGSYDQLAIGYTNEKEPLIVSELLAMCKGAVGKTFTGYKGGEYTMSRNTPVWVANWGESGETAIVGVSLLPGVTLETRMVEL